MGETVSPTLVGTPPVQGAVLPGAQPLPGATAGLFGSGGQFGLTQALQTTSMLSTGIGAFASYQSGQIQAGQYQVQAAQYDLQAKGLKLQAQEQSNALRKQLLQDIGSARALASGRGIDPFSGSAQRIVEQSVTETDRAIRKIAVGGQLQAIDAQTAAARSRSEARYAQIGGRMRAGVGLTNLGLNMTKMGF